MPGYEAYQANVHRAMVVAFLENSAPEIILADYGDTAPEAKADFCCDADLDRLLAVVAENGHVPDPQAVGQVMHDREQTVVPLRLLARARSTSSPAFPAMTPGA